MYSVLLSSQSIELLKITLEGVKGLFYLQSHQFKLASSGVMDKVRWWTAHAHTTIDSLSYSCSSLRSLLAPRSKSFKSQLFRLYCILIVWTPPPQSSLLFSSLDKRKEDLLAKGALKKFVIALCLFLNSHFSHCFRCVVRPLRGHITSRVKICAIELGLYLLRTSTTPTYLRVSPVS